MQTENTEIKHEALLEPTYNNDCARAGLVQWLASKQTFRGSDAKLVNVIVNTVGQPSSEDDREASLGIDRECSEKPAVAELRRRADTRRSPFHFVGAKVRVVGVPDERPPRGRADACRDGEFWRRTVRLTYPGDSQRLIQVEFTGHYPCTDPTAPDIQLTEEDAISLFGGPTRQFEEAVAAVVE